MKGKLIIIEGTDCSGKQTQAEKLIERLNSEGIDLVKLQVYIMQQIDYIM